MGILSICIWVVFMYVGVYVCLCTTHVWCLRIQEEALKSWSWSCRYLWATMWVQKTEPGPLQEQQVLQMSYKANFWGRGRIIPSSSLDSLFRMSLDTSINFLGLGSRHLFSHSATASFPFLPFNLFRYQISEDSTMGTNNLLKPFLQ